MEDTVNRLQLTVLLIAIAVVLFILYPVTYNLKPSFAQTPALAQTSACGTGAARATDLVSTPSLTGTFSTSSGACIIDPKAAFVPFKIPTYEDLKSLYYDQK